MTENSTSQHINLLIAILVSLSTSRSLSWAQGTPAGVSEWGHAGLHTLHPDPAPPQMRVPQALYHIGHNWMFH